MSETSDKLAKALRSIRAHLANDPSAAAAHKQLADAIDAAIAPQRGLLCGTTPDGRPYALRGTPESVDAVSDLIEQATDQDAQDAKDAARYRWLRDKSRQMSRDPDMSGNHSWLFGCNISYALRGPTADAAIDSAMAKEPNNAT